MRDVRAVGWQAVLFDCDGVLVDSEPIVNRILYETLLSFGWPVSHEGVVFQYTGHTIRDAVARDAVQRGVGLPEGWHERFMARRNAALQAELSMVPGADVAVDALYELMAGRIACASGADRYKIEMQLAQVGLLVPGFEGRVFSGHEVPRTKPAPDVYLAAARHLGVEPRHCLVIEDSAVGARAGLAAGATVWGYDPSGRGSAFEGLGVHRVFTDMADLPRLVQTC